MEFVGQYIITKKIGEGGMGKVFRAWRFSDAGFKKLFALKILKSEKYMKLFINEAKISARFENENIVKTLDFGNLPEQSKPFIVMEYIKGVNLREFIDRVGELPIEVFLFIAERILDAVSYIHRFEGRKLVHRDINMRNILVSWDGSIKLSDFGITLPQNSEIDPFGKLGYTPPEVIKGKGWSQFGDIWSVGATLWELITGEKIFQGRNKDELKNKVIKGEITPPSLINPIVPDWIEKMIMKSLSTLPELRYFSADDMLEEIRKKSREAGIKPIYRGEFSYFIESYFKDKIKDEEYEIAQEEIMVSNFLIRERKRYEGGSVEENSKKQKSDEINYYLATYSKNKDKDKEKKYTEDIKTTGRDEKRKNKERRRNNNNRNIRAMVIVFSVLAGFTLGILKAVSDMKKAEKLFRQGVALMKEKNFKSAKELLEKSKNISGLEEINMIIEKIWELNSEDL